MSKVTFSELASAPATPSTNKWSLYTKAGGLYIIDDAGTETLISAGAGSGDHRVTDTNNTTAVRVASVIHDLSSGVGATNMGGWLELVLDNDTGPTEKAAGWLRFYWADPTSTQEDAVVSMGAMHFGTLSDTVGPTVMCRGDTNSIRLLTGDTATGGIGGIDNQFRTATNNAIKDVILCNTILSAGNGAAGLGAKLKFQMTNSVGATHDAGGISSEWVSPTTTAEVSRLKFYRYDGGSEVTAVTIDTLFRLHDSTDDTKIVSLDMSAITTGTTRAVAFPDKAGTLAMLSDISAPGTGDVETLDTELNKGTVASVDWVIPAGKLSANGQWVEAMVGGRSAGGGGGTVVLKIDGVTMHTVASAVSQNATFYVQIIRDSTTTGQALIRVIDGGGTAYTVIGAVNATWTGAVNVTVVADANYCGILKYGPDA